MPPEVLSRRDAVLSMVWMAGGTSAWLTRNPAIREPRLTARPRAPREPAAGGRTEFTLRGSRAVIHVPAAVQRTRPAPLVLFFHGALRTVDAFVDSHQPLAEELGVIILAPYATEGTWDAIGGDFGRDVDVVDRALRWTFDRWAVDPGRVGLSGFSDGGTYALALGRANGDLFGRVAAYSPGFLLPVTPVGRPSILISHGTDDAVLPINRTSRRIVPELERQGYTVDYREFAGPHVLSRSAMEAFVRGVVG